MKRFILPTVFFYCCTFAALSPVRAFASALPALSIIAETQIGETMVQELAVDRILKMVDPPKASPTPPFTVPTSATTALSGLVAGSSAMAGIAFYARTGRDPVYSAASAVASAADALFVPAYQAFKANFVSPETYPASAAQYVGVEASVGAKVGDLAELASSHPATFPALNTAIAAASTTMMDPSNPPAVGQTLKILPSLNNYIINSYAGITLMHTYHFPADGTPPAGYNYWVQGFEGLAFVYTMGGYLYVKTGRIVNLNDQPAYEFKQYQVTLSSVNNPLPNPVSDINFSTLKDALSNMTQSLSNEIKQAISQLDTGKQIISADPAPSAVPAPSQTAITNEQVSNFFTQNTSNVFNEYNNVANNAESTYNDIEAAKAAAELAKQQEEEQKKEESFPPIASSAFEEPYDPGPYDIPERFSSFLNTVKSSGLFSFSSSFFNSLPGGGSPVYQIEAGQYGSHTIDLSQTMSTGLAVLKTILLACFGFLSIRAVIMKR